MCQAWCPALLIGAFHYQSGPRESRELNGVAKVKLSNNLQSGDMMPAGNKTVRVIGVCILVGKAAEQSHV